MSDYYRSSNYRRKRRREKRRLIALVAVIFMVVCIGAGYAIVRLIPGFSNLKENLNTAASDTKSATDSENDVRNTVKENSEESEAGRNAASGAGVAEKNDKNNLSSDNEASKDISNENSTVKPDDSKEPEIKPEKPDIEKLITVEDSVAEEYFKDTVFVGDSRTQGLQINADISSADFFAGRGLNVKNALTEKVIRQPKNKMITVVEALKGKQYKKVYIAFGINELGWSYPEIFIKEYKNLISEIRKIQPKAEIVVQAILPVTQKKSSKDKIFNMKNIKKFNKLIKAMAKDIDATYADLSPAVRNKKGYLPKSVTPDGVHMNKPYCQRIIAYIVNMEI